MTLQELHDALDRMIRDGVYPGNIVQVYEASEYGDFTEAYEVFLALDEESKKRVIRIVP